MEIPYGSFHSLKCAWEFPIADFLVVARPDVPGLYILNSSSKLIWRLLKKLVPFGELVREFATEYDISVEVAAQDVGRTLQDWESGLLSTPINSPSLSLEVQMPADLEADYFVDDYLIQGKKVRVSLGTSELAEEIVPRLKSLPHAPPHPDLFFKVVEDSGGFRIYCGDCCVAVEETAGAIRAVLLQEIVRICRGQDCLAVFHAGACGSNSQCVVFPATTQSGKTTLAAVLMKMGLTLYSDDSVILERGSLSVPAMPFKLMVREGSWDVLSPRFPELQDEPVVTRYGQRVRFLWPIGMKTENHCERIGALVFSRFTPDALNEMTALDPLSTLLRLQESGFWVAHDEQSIRAFLTWVQLTPSFTLSYSDVDRAACTIRRLIA